MKFFQVNLKCSLNLTCSNSTYHFELVFIIRPRHQSVFGVSGLNPKSLIQLSETLPIELTGTHSFLWVDVVTRFSTYSNSTCHLVLVFLGLVTRSTTWPNPRYQFSIVYKNIFFKLVNLVLLGFWDFIYLFIYY